MAGAQGTLPSVSVNVAPDGVGLGVTSGVSVTVGDGSGVQVAGTSIGKGLVGVGVSTTGVPEMTEATGTPGNVPIGSRVGNGVDVAVAVTVAVSALTVSPADLVAVAAASCVE